MGVEQRCTNAVQASQSFYSPCHRMTCVDAFHPELARARGRPVIDHVRHVQACPQQPIQEYRRKTRLEVPDQLMGQVCQCEDDRRWFGVGSRAHTHQGPASTAGYVLIRTFSSGGLVAVRELVLGIRSSAQNGLTARYVVHCPREDCCVVLVCVEEAV